MNINFYKTNFQKASKFHMETVLSSFTITYEIGGKHPNPCLVFKLQMFIKALTEIFIS